MMEFLTKFFNDPFHYTTQMIFVIAAVVGVVYFAKEYLSELFGKDETK